jgi:hypothetical protein
MWYPPILIFYVTDKARARREEGRRCRCYERRIYHIKRKKDEKQRKKSFFQILQHRLWANRVKTDTKIVSHFFFLVYLQQNEKTREPRERNVRLKL